MSLKNINKTLQVSRKKDPEGRGFNICYTGKDAFDKLENEIDKIKINFKFRHKQLHLITPAFEWCGCFFVVSSLVPDNVTMMGWVEEAELKHQKEIVGWPL